MRTRDWLRWFILTGLMVFEWALVLGIFIISAQQVRSRMSEPAIATALMGVVFSVIAFSLNKSRPRY
ncbi:MAG: hypothetical protein H0X37_22660 [Herpetosiphonaceae bacterium]|nr:hypothetical protein [Herpetosiphonaceae bacterium]